ncbi:MAG TPA: OmpA family protein [Geminicoccaceae bacterium]|nr:OmpA family protein [Geminicoccaceae bacterium]
MRAISQPLLGTLLLALGACTTALPPEKTPALGGPYNEEIKQGYVRLAQAARESTDFADWYHFRAKARAAMLGDAVWPDKVASREVPPAARTEAVVLRERLLRALEGNARKRAPVDAGAAQTNFDCWLEELESITDPERFSGCKDIFVAALAEAESALIDTPYVIFFEPGSDELDPDAMNVITRAVWAARIGEPGAIAVTGYADPSGEADANLALSQRRAQAVAEALRGAGVAAASDLRVAARGADVGASGPRARRVEITFGG